MWSAFHQLCLVQLPQVWEKFLSSIEIEWDDDLLQQTVNQKLLLTTDISTSSQESRVSGDLELNKDELSGLRYACDYLPHALLKKYVTASLQLH